MSKRKIYMVLDTETATLPFVNELCSGGEQKKKIAIAKPLVYDIGWQIITKQGKILKQRSYIIAEIFSVPTIFLTAYYKDKRPLYIGALQNGHSVLTDWNTAVKELVTDMQQCDAIGAYNAMFDFKKAIPYTESYIRAIYSSNYEDFIAAERFSCKQILENVKSDYPKHFDKESFTLRGISVPLFDIWGLACERILNNGFREYCYKNSAYTDSGQYFSTSAENVYRYFSKSLTFNEAHTALADCDIERQILVKCLAKKKMETGLTYFPFKKVGITYEMTENIMYLNEIYNIIDNQVCATGANQTKKKNILATIERIMEEVGG
jgi:hypothetical protein